jgi:hypothetical protein
VVMHMEDTGKRIKSGKPKEWLPNRIMGCWYVYMSITINLRYHHSTPLFMCISVGIVYKKYLLYKHEIFDGSYLVNPKF